MERLWSRLSKSLQHTRPKYSPRAWTGMCDDLDLTHNVHKEKHLKTTLCVYLPMPIWDQWHPAPHCLSHFNKLSEFIYTCSCERSHWSQYCFNTFGLKHPGTTPNHLKPTKKIQGRPLKIIRRRTWPSIHSSHSLTRTYALMWHTR